MNIVFYSPQFFPSIGGLQNVVKDWALEFHRYGWQVSVICTTPATEPDNFSFRVYRNIGFFRQLKLMKEANYVLMFNVSLKAMFQLLLSGTPLIINHQTELYNTGRIEPIRQWLKKMVADHIAILNFACSASIAKVYKECAVIGNPYDASLFKKLDLPRGQKFLFVGRLVSDKGVDILIEAFIAYRRNEESNFDLTIVGDGTEREVLKNKVDLSGLSAHVHFKGIISGEALAILMNEHQVMVVPSKVEPFGIVALEGLACGCKMIVSNTSGLPEAAGGLAALVPPNNPEALALAMVQQLQQPYPSADAVAKHLKNFTISATAAQLVQLLQSCIRK